MHLFEHFNEGSHLEFFKNACFVSADRALGQVQFDGYLFGPITFDQHIHHFEFALREVFQRVFAVWPVVERITQELLLDRHADVVTSFEHGENSFSDFVLGSIFG
ncbi:hypothetical protein D3C87_1917930 [compost metagenome]